MSELLVTGSIGIDSVDAPTGSRHDCMGGSATYFSLAAAKLCPVRLVGAVGEDFPPEFTQLLQSQGVGTEGLEVRKGSKTFRWHGKYSEDMNDRDTLDVKLNVLAEEGPSIPESYRDSEYVFLANNDPMLQLAFIEQLKNPKLVVFDTMNLWIAEHRDNLLKVFAKTDGVVINDAEAKMLTEKGNVITAAKEITKLGPKYVVIKKGEHGVILSTPNGILALPAFATEKVMDPTGAGDSFAGGMMGYLTKSNAAKDDEGAWREAMVYATVAASFTVESFSVDGLTNLDEKKFQARLDEFRKMITP